MENGEKTDERRKLIESLPEHLRVIFEKKLKELYNELDTELKDWHFDLEKEGLKQYYKKDNVWVIQRSEFEVGDISLETMVKYQTEPGFRHKYDNLLQAYEIIKEIQPNVHLVRVEIKGKFMLISPRDFVGYRIFGWLDANVLWA